MKTDEKKIIDQLTLDVTYKRGLLPDAGSLLPKRLLR
jgi:hypothetical protein